MKRKSKSQLQLEEAEKFVSFQQSITVKTVLAARRRIARPHALLHLALKEGHHNVRFMRSYAAIDR
jgi:hypothetical protein